MYECSNNARELSQFIETAKWRKGLNLFWFCFWTFLFLLLNFVTVIVTVVVVVWWRSKFIGKNCFDGQMY